MIKVIKTEKENEKALARIFALMNNTKKNTAQADELELLVVLVEKYESEHYPISSPDPVEFLKYVMEERGLQQSDLVKYIGNKSTVSQIMSRKRSMTVDMIRNLSRGLSIPVGALVGA